MAAVSSLPVGAISHLTTGRAQIGTSLSIPAFGPLALMITVLRPAAYVALAGGIRLALSPWVLGYATNHEAWLNELVSGGLLIVLCWHAAEAGALMRVRRRRGPGAPRPRIRRADRQSARVHSR